MRRRLAWGRAIATCRVGGYEVEERAGRVIRLAPGEARRYRIEIHLSPGGARMRGVNLAGHLCLDLIPTLPRAMSLSPGTPANVGSISTSTGGCVLADGRMAHLLESEEADPVPTLFPRTEPGSDEP